MSSPTDHSQHCMDQDDKLFNTAQELSEAKIEIDRLMFEIEENHRQIDSLTTRLKMEECVSKNNRKKYLDTASEYNELLDCAKDITTFLANASIPLKVFKPIATGRKRNQKDFDF